MIGGLCCCHLSAKIEPLKKFVERMDVWGRLFPPLSALLVIGRHGSGRGALTAFSTPLAVLRSWGFGRGLYRLSRTFPLAAAGISVVVTFDASLVELPPDGLVFGYAAQGHVSEYAVGHSVPRAHDFLIDGPEPHYPDLDYYL